MALLNLKKLTPAPNTNNDCAPAMIATLPNDTATHDDCAPADNPPVAASRAIDTAVLMQQVAQLYSEPLVPGYWLVFSPFSPYGTVVLNATGWERLQKFATPQPPTEAIDFTFLENNLIVPVGQIPTLMWQRPVSLTAWLHVTNACNLDCPYCYVRKSAAHMDENTGYGILDQVFRSALQHGFQAVKLKYAGGEAALHFSLVKKLHRYAQKLSVQLNITLESVVLSNGTFWTPSMANWAAKNDVTIVISLDGIGSVHDALRPTVAGYGSFEQIEHNVDNILRPAGVIPEIAVTVSGQNADTIDQVVFWALERNLMFTLNFYRENILSQNRDELRIEETKIIAGMKKAYRQIEKNLPEQLSVNGLLDRTNLMAHTHTCGVGQNYLVFSHTGKLAQCQMMLDEATDVDQLDDPLSFVATGVIPHSSVDEKEGCRSCMWRYCCAGGCPIETYRVTGRFDVKSPHCNIYTILFPNVLRLEGLHILKTNSIL